MDFKIGYSVKPKEITTRNIVIYEGYIGIEGLVDVIPTQGECEAYGFNFINGKCYVIANSTDFIDGSIHLEAGSNNSKGAKTNYTATIGLNNEIKYACSNDLIVGNNNSIIDSIDNTIVSGTKGEATASNSIVLGGNAPDDNLAERQFSTMMYGGYTTNGNTQSSYLNNTTSSFYQVPTDTAMYFHAEAIAVRVGGTGTGNIGDYASFVQRGVVINKSGVLSVNSERDNIKHSGTTSHWRTSGNVSGTDFYIGVRGAANVNIEWAISIRFTEIRTGVAL